MKTMADLTPEIEAKIPEYIARALEGVSDGGRHREFNIDKAREAVDWNYRKAGFEPPERILVAENPLEMNIMYNIEAMKDKYGADVDVTDPKYKDELFAANSSYLFTLNFYSDGYYAWYEFIRKEFEIELSINDEFQECFRLQKASGVCQLICADVLAVVCKYPLAIHWDDENRLHSTSGVAVEWGVNKDSNEYGIDTSWDNCYFIHGRAMDKRVFSGFSREDFLNEQDEDIRAGMYEVIEAKGEGSMLEFLGAKKVHNQTFVHDNGDLEEMELYRTDEVFEGEEDLNGNSPAALAWLKMICPSTGTVYLIPSDSSFETCEEAAKFHRPNYVEKDLPYSWMQRN